MYICLCDKNANTSEEKKIVRRAINEGMFVNFNEKMNAFVDANNQIIDLKDKLVIPYAGIQELPQMITRLSDVGAIIPNSLGNIDKILNWFRYIKPARLYINFKGNMLKDKVFLIYLLEIFKDQTEAFLKTVKKDFNGIIDLTDIFEDESDLRKAFGYHGDDEFILSPKVNIDYDELGKIEYRAFIYEGKIMNVSRVLNNTYHKIPREVLKFIESILEKLPVSFPKTFSLDIFAYDGKLDILEFNPYEASGFYLYNTIFEASTDLLHENITDVPLENESSELSFTPKEDMIPSTLEFVPNTFSNDYSNIKKYGERLGFFMLSGESDNFDLKRIRENFDFISSEDDL